MSKTFVPNITINFIFSRWKSEVAVQLLKKEEQTVPFELKLRTQDYTSHFSPYQSPLSFHSIGSEKENMREKNSCIVVFFSKFGDQK